MTPISFRLAARLNSVSSSPVTGAITVDRAWKGHSKYLVGPTALSEQFKVPVGNIISPPHTFAGGFVDFLMGRRARYPR
jgi:hypothetical protein